MPGVQTYVDGNVLSAADLNNYLSAPTFASYTATTTVITEGNGTKTASWTQQGYLVHFRFRFVFGSTSAMGAGAPTVTLPTTAVATTPQGSAHVYFYDLSTTTYTMGFVVFGTTTVTLYRTAAGGSYVDSGNVSSTIPFTWTTGDWVEVAGWYEDAA